MHLSGALKLYLVHRGKDRQRNERDADLFKSLAAQARMRDWDYKLYQTNLDLPAYNTPGTPPGCTSIMDMLQARRVHAKCGAGSGSGCSPRLHQHHGHAAGT